MSNIKLNEAHNKRNKHKQHLHHKEPLEQYSESDRTRCHYHTEPLVALEHVAMWPAYFEHRYIDYQLANISSTGTGADASFFKQTYRQTDIT